jgi:HYDIN/CFA65/VesB-like, Ig-like domain
VTLTGTVWAPIGPSPMAQGGRQDNGLTTAIAINPNNPNIIYQGTAGGGVWRTLDGGDTWAPIFDRQLSLGIGEPGAIAIDPTDTSIIYVGTSTRVTPQAQAGLFRSIDGGASCIRLGSGFPAGNVGNASQFFNQIINEIIVDPARPATLYMATSTGVYRSTDSGQNWTFGTGSSGDARSLVLDATSPAGARILYAGITGVGVLQSTNGGANWAPILNAATPAVSAAVGGGGFSKAIVALAPPTSPPNAGGVQVLYATLSGTGGAPDPVGIFVTTDQGANWNQQAGTGMPTRTQGGYSFHMAVDPASPGDGANDIVYMGCVGHGRSTDAGNNFTPLSGLHADNHAWAFMPQAAPTPTIVYCGNDGGLFRSTDNGATWVARNSGGIQTALFYNLVAKPDVGGTSLLGALQDNGIQTTAGAASPGWNSPQGGDGWDIAFDGGTAGRAYGTSGFWSPAPCTRVWRSDDDGASWPTEVTPWGTTSDAGCYLATVACDPSVAGRVYVSGNQNLWQSQDGGNNWRNLGAFPGNVAVSPTNGNNVVVASGTQVFVSTNALASTVGAPAGVTFTNITRNLPARAVLRAAIDPSDPTVIYAVLGGFDGFGPGQQGHVFRTTVAGTAWQNLSPNLNVPFGGLALDGTDTPTTIYVGTDFGVLRSVDEGATWTVLDDIRFPRAAVTDLVLSQGGVLRAATYGRGVLEFRTPQGPAIAVFLDNGLDFGTVCAGRHFLTLQIFNVGVEDLVINSVQRLMGSTGFSVLPSPGTPLIVGPGEEIDFEIEFSPTTPGVMETATIRIVSNDPGAPVVDLAATGQGGRPVIVVAVPDRGHFGDVCLGDFVDRDIVISNRGPCPLEINGLTSSAPEFDPPDVTFFPITVAAGSSIALPIRFRPSGFGSASATISISSDDPLGPTTIGVSGTAPSGTLVITGSGHFGPVDFGRRAERTITLHNTGECDLHVTNVGFLPDPWKPGCRDYDRCNCDCGCGNHSAGKESERLAEQAPAPDELPGASVHPCCGPFKIVSNPFPATVHPGSSLPVLIRFTATCSGPKCCELMIETDDPSAPSSIVYVTGSLHRTLRSALKCWAADELQELLGAGKPPC